MMLNNNMTAENTPILLRESLDKSHMIITEDIIGIKKPPGTLYPSDMFFDFEVFNFSVANEIAR